MFNSFKKNKEVIAGLLLVAATVEGSCGLDNNLVLNSKYIGFDAGIQSSGFNKYKLSSVLYKKSLPKANFFAGLKFNEYLGIEAGYDFNLNRSKNATIPESEETSHLGVPDAIALRLGESTEQNGKYKISGFHFGVTGEYPISTNNNSISLISYVGIKHAIVDLKTKIVAHPLPAIIGEVRSLKASKNILRLSLGLQYMLRENIGFRLNGTWENTSKLSPEKNDNVPGVGSKLFSEKLKNSMSYSLGVVFKF